MRTWIPPVAAALTAVTLTACGLPPMVSDTGYQGTWRRDKDRHVWIVAIARVGERWYVRSTKRTADGRRLLRCDWDGRCEETLDGKPVATYAVATKFEEATGVLATDTVEERTAPTPQTFRLTEVMEIADRGRTLWAYTTDRDGARFEGDARPGRSFSKVSNSVADPPRPERP